MKTIRLKAEAKESIKQGINTVYECAKVTLGAGGRNAILGKEFSRPLITNDGISIINEIEVEDEIEMLGVDLMKSVAQRTNEEVGDGTTTTIVLTKNVIDKCFDQVDSLAGSNVMELSRKVKEDCKEVVELLKKQAKKIKNKQDIRDIAMTSVENEELADIIADVFNKVGKEGFVTYEEGTDFKTKYEISKGYELDRICVSKYMETEVKNPRIAIFDKNVNDTGELSPITNGLNQDGISELVVFAKDFSEDVIATLNLNIVDNKFKVIAVKVNDEEIKDLSALTGASVIRKVGETIKVGKAKMIRTSQVNTLLVGGSGDTDDRIKELESKETSSEYEKETIKKKVAQLGKGVGIIKVGGSTEEEREYLKYKVEDAINATKSALEEGYVSGGGRALASIAGELKDNMLKDVILSPNKQVLENSGGAKIPDNIIDSLKVTRVALENACSLASVVLTTEVAIAKNDKERTLEV